MATFYKKTDEGEFVEADAEVDKLFREKSGKIVSAKLNAEREKLRSEMEEEVRESALVSIKKEAKKELEAEFAKKLEASELKASELDVKLRRKTIAAEYGFRPEAEEFLGNGDDDEMRAKADILRDSFGKGDKMPSMEKESEPKASKLQESTGITVTI